jgi:spore germination protein KC
MLASKETAITIPAVRLIKVNGKPTHYITGAAVLKEDKLLGYLSDSEAKSLIWLKNELKGGLFVVSNIGEKHTNVALEITKSKTKIKPEVIDGKLSIKIDIVVDANIGEITGSDDFISEKGRIILKKAAEKQIKGSLNNLIEKAQKEYKIDFLGFGEKVHNYMPNIWNSIEKQWNEVFADMETSINVNVRIKGSATSRKPIKVGM